ncbi:hypothetical protein MMC17_006224 [Xylographa soralifera]|nr:hypothetical protein [Xylographa soralifera]
MEKDTKATMQETHPQLQQTAFNTDQHFKLQQTRMEFIQRELACLRPIVSLVQQPADDSACECIVPVVFYRWLTHLCLKAIKEDNQKQAAEHSRHFEGIQSTLSQMAGHIQPAAMTLQLVISQQDLFARIGINIECFAKGLQMSASLGGSMEMAGHDTAKWLAWNNQFKTWFLSKNSQLLLVKGFMPSELVTPSSYFSAMLLLSLHDLKPAFPLYFFCGMPNSDLSSGSEVLLRSLIAQILIRYRCDTGFLTLQAVNQIASFEPNNLWHLFAILIESLHDTVVFCVIDGFARYRSKPEAFFVLQGLQSLVAECTGNVILKVLLTDPVPLETMHYIPRHDTLMIPPNPEGHGHGLNEHQIMGMMG